MLSSTFNQYRHDAERRINEKDEEIESIRWVFSAFLSLNLRTFWDSFEYFIKFSLHTTF